MTRQADPNAKLKRLIFIPKTPEEEQLSQNFKKLSIQDNLEVHDLLLEAISLVFKQHHYPPGNPQLRLDMLLNASNPHSIINHHCGFKGCREKAVVTALFVNNGKTYALCQRHFAEAKQSGSWRV